MKIEKFRQCLTIVVCFLLIGPALYAGNGGVNGGDPKDQLRAREVTALAREMLTGLSQLSITFFSRGDLAKLSRVVLSLETKVSFEDIVLFEGREVAAINIPSQMSITFCRPCYDKTSDLGSKLAIILHEYLGLAGLEENHYRLSNALVTEMLGHGVLGYAYLIPLKPSRRDLERLRTPVRTPFVKVRRVVFGPEVRVTFFVCTSLVKCRPVFPDDQNGYEINRVLQHFRLLESRSYLLANLTRVLGAVAGAAVGIYGGPAAAAAGFAAGFSVGMFHGYFQLPIFGEHQMKTLFAGRTVWVDGTIEDVVQVLRAALASSGR